MFCFLYFANIARYVYYSMQNCINNDVLFYYSLVYASFDVAFVLALLLSIILHIIDIVCVRLQLIKNYNVNDIQQSNIFIKKITLHKVVVFLQTLPLAINLFCIFTYIFSAIPIAMYIYYVSYPCNKISKGHEISQEYIPTYY